MQLGVGRVTVGKGSAAVTIGIHIDVNGLVLGAMFQHKICHGAHLGQVGAAGQVQAFAAQGQGLHVFTGQTQGVAEVDHQKYGQNTRRSIAQPGLCLLLGQFGAQAKQHQQVKRRKDQALVVAQGLGTGKQHHRPQAGRGGYNSLCTGAAAIQQPH